MGEGQPSFQWGAAAGQLTEQAKHALALRQAPSAQQTLTAWHHLCDKGQGRRRDAVNGLPLHCMHERQPGCAGARLGSGSKSDQQSLVPATTKAALPHPACLELPALFLHQRPPGPQPNGASGASPPPVGKRSTAAALVGAGYAGMHACNRSWLGRLRCVSTCGDMRPSTQQHSAACGRTSGRVMNSSLRRSGPCSTSSSEETDASGS